MFRAVLFLTLGIQCLVVYGQRYDAPRVELLDNDGIYDSFCIGDVMFVSLESDIIFSTAQGKRGIENVPALKSVIEKASPNKRIQEFVDHLLGYHHAFAFESATVFDCGGLRISMGRQMVVISFARRLIGNSVRIPLDIAS